MNIPRKGTLQKKADPLWSKCVILIWGKCAKCGTTNNLTAHHEIHRDNKANRYRLDNGMCLCANCHTFGSGPHTAPDLWAKWLIEEYPKRAERKLLRKNDLLPLPRDTVEWYREQIARLRVVLKRLEAFEWR